MNAFTRMLVTIVALLPTLSVTLPAHAAYFPNQGDLRYDGYFFADSYFLWDYPGQWATSDPGYEHDLGIRSYYFEDCTSWTNLPNGYNDCPTAGVSEPSDLWTFSFGSFHARNIGAWTWYYGAWNFSSGSALSTDFYLNGQENKKQFCWWDSIWCMGAVRTQPLRSGWLYWGEPYYTTWSF
jgi:hypothetical protein